MSISQLCAAAQRCISPRITNVFAIVSTLLIFATVTFGATLAVPAGGDLQAAINTASAGDTIVLEAGAIYRGPFTLIPKSGESFITIQSSRASEITGRVSPAQSDLLAKLRSNTPAESIIKTVAGAHHYKLVGLDISTFSASDFIYDLVRLGDSSQTDLSKIPHHLILDRLWVHGFETQEMLRGITLNSAETSIINSYVSDIHAIDTDTQAICGWNGPGPFLIANNYLEAAGENVMFGGADPSIVGLIPSDITIRQNHFFKPLSWKVGHPSYAGRHWTVKNLLETKNARRVLIDGNLFENVWPDAQVGFAILLKSNNQDSTAPWSVTEDLTFSNNIVRNAENGLNMLAVEVPPKISAVANRLRIVNNFWNVQKIWFQGSNGARDVLFDHNTFFSKEGSTANLYGLVTQGFVFRNNLGVRAGYGIKGDGTSEGIAALNVFCPGWIFEKNVIVRASPLAYPGNNFYPRTLGEVGFVDLNGGDYRLTASSPYRNGATDGKDIGVDFDALNAAMGGGAPAPAPTSTPTPTPTPTPIPTPTPTLAPTPEQKAFIQFSSASYNINEDAGFVTITLIRTGNTAQRATIKYKSSAGSALSRSDYSELIGTLTFAAGESAKSFTVPILDDAVAEANETFNLTLSVVSNANLGSPTTATVTIVDNDKAESIKTPRLILSGKSKSGRIRPMLR
ncbi:MAG TPA: Calx-beta domain-containing protein [Pyrinomonadaceae bacterium]|nr:Calx-beta domain-containing protein [Pyrinomonadaceae bacterium]